MPKTAILTDSACDIPDELLAEYPNIRILNFTLTVGERVYTERVDFTPQEYHRLLRETDQLPVTSLINSFEFLKNFEGYAADGVEDLIVVTIAAVGSATYDAALLARKHFEGQQPSPAMRIHIVDSHTYSMAYGQPICEAAAMLLAGEPVQKVIDFLEDAFARSELVLSTYTLKYIRQSGRISACAALAGDFLGLRPIVSMVDGGSVVKSKVRGDKQVLPALVQYFIDNAVPGSPYQIGTTDMENAAVLAGLCEQAVGYPPIRWFYLGCCVTTNTGPEAIAITYYGPKRR